MNFTTIISALEFAIEHRQEIAAETEAAIHFIRRVEHACVKHDTTADKILLAADSFLTAFKDVQPD